MFGLGSSHHCLWACVYEPELFLSVRNHPIIKQNDGCLENIWKVGNMNIYSHASINNIIIRIYFIISRIKAEIIKHELVGCGKVLVSYWYFVRDKNILSGEIQALTNCFLSNEKAFCFSSIVFLLPQQGSLICKVSSMRLPFKILFY